MAKRACSDMVHRVSQCKVDQKRHRHCNLQRHALCTAALARYVLATITDLRGETMASGLPFDDFRALLGQLPAPDEMARDRVRSALAGQPDHAGALGRLGEIAIWHAAWSGTGGQPVARPLVAVFAGNHGLAGDPDAPYDMTVTKQLVERCTAGNAAVNALCAADELGLRVFDLALELPTADIRRDAALDERGCAATMAFGMEAIAGGVDLIALAGAGEGNDAASAALLAATLGGDAAEWSGDAATAQIVADALDRHGNHLADPLEALRRVGGRELAAVAGAILAARMERIPVVLGGLAACATASVMWKADNQAVAHCLIADCGGEAHARAARAMGIEPMFDFRIEAPDGTAAALGAGMVKRAVAASIGATAVAGSA